MSLKRAETYEPDDLARLGSMFDDVWTAVAGPFACVDEATRTSARSRLAGIILELIDRRYAAGDLKQRAIDLFHQAYPPATPLAAMGDAVGEANDSLGV